LRNLTIDEYCSDNWEAFVNVFSEENHQIGKYLTRPIEGVNNSLRVRNRHFVRKTCCFSKKDQYHEAAIKIMFQQRNYAYHTIRITFQNIDTQFLLLKEKFYGKEVIYIIKENLYANWTKTKAFEDGQEIINQFYEHE
jgi:hypothetical protein